MVQDLRDGGSFLLNCGWTDEELDKHLPGQVKKFIADHKIKLYTIDGITIGKEIGLGSRINTILQAAFFKLANVIPVDDAVKYMKDAATKTYGRKGEKLSLIHIYGAAGGFGGSGRTGASGNNYYFSD